MIWSRLIDKIVAHYTEVGVFYCTLHHGVMNEDDYRCDFASFDPTGREEPAPCTPERLYYRRRR